MQYVFERIYRSLGPEELNSFVERNGTARDTFMARVQKLYGDARLSMSPHSAERLAREIFVWYRGLPSRGDRENKLLLEKFRGFLSVEEPKPFYLAHPELFSLLEGLIGSTTSTIVVLLILKNFS